MSLQSWLFFYRIQSYSQQDQGIGSDQRLLRLPLIPSAPFHTVKELNMEIDWAYLRKG